MQVIFTAAERVNESDDILLRRLATTMSMVCWDMLRWVPKKRQSSSKRDWSFVTQTPATRCLCCEQLTSTKDQYLLIAFLGGWTSIYQLFWCSPGEEGFDTLPHQQKSRMICSILFRGAISIKKNVSHWANGRPEGNMVVWWFRVAAIHGSEMFWNTYTCSSTSVTSDSCPCLVWLSVETICWFLVLYH